MFFSSRYLRYPVTAAIAATCPVLYQARSSCMVVDRNQRCYTNCVRWLRHKGILLESSPREWLMGYITTRVIMENTLLTANATLIGPQHGDQAQLMGPLKGGGNLFYLTTRLF